MKKVLAFDIDQTLNVAKTPIPDEIADLLIGCLKHFEICPISGQKFDQFLIQIVDRLVERGATPVQLSHLHLFVAQGTQYYRYQPSSKKFGPVEVTVIKSDDTYSKDNWEQVYNFPLTDDEVKKITATIKQAAEELGYWEEDKLQPGDEIIENRLSQVTFSALGQKAGTKEKYAWDPDCKKREKIVARCKELAPEFDYEIGGTTSINAITPGMNKVFGMTHLLDELHVKKSDVLYFGDMTQPGGNDYPVIEMGIDTITVRSHEDTAYALRGILGVIGDESHRFSIHGSVK
ncbi:HAD-IIB family hydrolase [Candidatus Saccharibacteria bacterium]|nr:HAD-IIB family hydrolase [Candidatus Saccharibacteria bacterium]